MKLQINVRMIVIETHFSTKEKDVYSGSTIKIVLIFNQHAFQSEEEIRCVFDEMIIER